MGTNSPLIAALGDKASTLNILLDDLYSQLQECEKLNPKARPFYQFHINTIAGEEDIVAANREFAEAMYRDEKPGHETVDDIYGTMIGKDRVQRYTTVARCPITNKPVTQRMLIGEHPSHPKLLDIPHIPWTDYVTIIDRTDMRLSERYRPRCIDCSTEQNPVHHKTILSYMQFIQPDLLAHIYSEEELANTIQQLTSLQKQTASLHVSTKEIDRRIDYNSKLLALKKKELSLHLENYEYLVQFVNLRRKGTGRLAEKVLYAMFERLATQAPAKQLPLIDPMVAPSGIIDAPEQLLDTTGIRAVGNDPLAIIMHTKEYLEAKDKSSLEHSKTMIRQRMQDPRDNTIKVIDEHILEVSGKGHRSYKLWAHHKGIPIAFQAMTYEEHELDSQDRPHYEERRSRWLNSVRARGYPVDQLSATLQRIFDHDAV